MLLLGWCVSPLRSGCPYQLDQKESRARREEGSGWDGGGFAKEPAYFPAFICRTQLMGEQDHSVATDSFGCFPLGDVEQRGPCACAR